MWHRTGEKAASLIASAPAFKHHIEMIDITDQGKVFIFADLIKSHPSHHSRGTDFHLTDYHADKDFTTNEKSCKHGDTLYLFEDTLYVGSPWCYNY